ncbi:MAG: hypothetical protein GXX92_11050 [Clostridiales bacterium]|nr:hypothetical protein [Clostridiales bacterium]
MDWTKAKAILIVALLITNLFLLATYTVVKADDGPTDEELQAETLALLEQKQIYIKGSLPTQHDKMPVLMVEYDRLDQEVLRQKLSDQTPMDGEHGSRAGILKMTEAFLKSCDLWGPNVVLNKIEQEENVTKVYYRNEYEGIPVEDSYIICTVEDGVVTEIDRLWLRPVGFGKSKKATISASAALIDIMRSKNERSTILVENMEMVYWLNPSDYEGETAISDTALPAWKVTYNGGQIKHVPAYND